MRLDGEPLAFFDFGEKTAPLNGRISEKTGYGNDVDPLIRDTDGKLASAQFRFPVTGRLRFKVY